MSEEATQIGDTIFLVIETLFIMYLLWTAYRLEKRVAKLEKEKK